VDSFFKDVEEASAKDHVEQVVHVYHVEGYLLSSHILVAAEGYRQRYGAYRLNSFSS
jgi:hypothetical protein